MNSLFVIKNLAGKTHQTAGSFESKEAAKAARDKLNENGSIYHVALGKNHIRYGTGGPAFTQKMKKKGI